MSELDAALQIVAGREPHLPAPLPIAHTTSARAFRAIVEHGALAPTRCDVFRRKVLYLFYGLPCYRPPADPTVDVEDYPVTFVFKPSTIAAAKWAYPFDTGLVHWHDSGRLRRFPAFKTRCRIPIQADGRRVRAMVRAGFGTNARYLADQVRNGQDLDVLRRLQDFYCEPPNGIDRRRSAIEIHYHTDLSFERLEWIGYPRVMGREFFALCELLQGDVPKFHPYDAVRTYRPADVASQLVAHARAHVQRYLDVELLDEAEERS